MPDPQHVSRTIVTEFIGKSSKHKQQSKLSGSSCLAELDFVGVNGVGGVGGTELAPGVDFAFSPSFVCFFSFSGFIFLVRERLLLILCKL